MSAPTPEVERQWVAEKRDFVGDRRDELADERGVAAANRDLTADARERALDRRERELEAREAALGLSRAEDGQRGLELLARGRAGQDRDGLEVARQVEAGARDEASERRLEAAPVTGLATAFATIAENLYAADSYDAVLLRIAETAVSVVAGCEMASVTVKEGGALRTASATDSAASAVDQAQYDAQEGPCLDAVDTPVVYAKAFPDERWPTLADQPGDLGAGSAASYRLAAASHATTGARAGVEGSLNTYGTEPEAFSDEAQQIGLILAAHASVVAGAARERDALEGLADNLNKALMSRDVIGQAKGILMERHKLTPEGAFDALRLASSRLNEKLHAVALDLAQTGELDSRLP